MRLRLSVARRGMDSRDCLPSNESDGGHGAAASALGGTMVTWLEWSVCLAVAAVALPLVAGEIAMRGGFFQSDSDDIGDTPRDRQAESRERSMSDRFREVDSPDPQRD